MDELYIGLMSGTSCDGIDACLVNFQDDEFQLQASLYHPYPEKTRESLLKILQHQHCSLEQLSDLDHDLAAINALTVKRLLQEQKLPADRITAIGYHGQTIFHKTDPEHRNSIQIGDPSFLASRTGISVVADLRRMDVASGGQGAPMVPAFHQYLFANSVETRAIINIGGIANLTVLPASESKPIAGFDTGPGNCLMDEWSLKHQQKHFDENGNWARHGHVLPDLLKAMQRDPYFALAHPKSTGREYFNQHWLAKFTEPGHRPEDVQASLLELTASTIAQAVRTFPEKIQHVYVCGGGAHNEFLLSRLGAALGSVKLDTTSALGLDPDWVEACAFAWLARQRILKQSGNLPSVTGASRAVICGGLYQV